MFLEKVECFEQPAAHIPSIKVLVDSFCPNVII